MANRIVDWIDQRFPLTRFIKHELTEYPTPRNLSYWWGFGFLAGFVLVLQIVSGVFLAMHYKPDINLAFDSIQNIMRNVNYGWLLRYLHSTGASAFFIVIYLHMVRTLYYGSYRAPRELMWWSGQVLLLLLMATAFMGYLLPWGQMSYWGAQVITSLFGTTPVVGDEVVRWLRGDFAIGDATLNRFFALHYLVPFLICGLVAIHLVALHYVKSSNPSGFNLKASDNIPFHPYFTLKDLFGLAVFMILFCAIVFFAPDAFIEEANNIPANPLQTPPHIVPEWYFLPFYAILRAIPDAFGGVVAMVLSIVIFAAMPFLDRSSIPGGARYRPLYRLMFYIFIVDVLWLGYIGTQPPTPEFAMAGEIATAIYFGVFLLLPFASRIEDRWLHARGLPDEVTAQMGAQPGPARTRTSVLLRYGPGVVIVAVLVALIYSHYAGRGSEHFNSDNSPQTLQRGAEVVTSVCMSCHSLKYVRYRDLAALGYSQAQIDAVRGEHPAAAPLQSMTPADVSKESYGVVPPDLSLMAKAREGGPHYLHAFLTGFYIDASGQPQNRVFPGTRMPDMLGISAAATPQARVSVEAQARDVAAFLEWAADPRAAERERLGYYVLGYLAVMAVLLYLLKRRIWARLDTAGAD